MVNELHIVNVVVDDSIIRNVFNDQKVLDGVLVFDFDIRDTEDRMVLVGAEKIEVSFLFSFDNFRHIF